MGVLVAPSILSADFGNLNADVEKVNRSAASLVHLDIMDGLFVPNISYGFPVIKAIAKQARKPLDAHLMIVNPDRYFERFADLGVARLSVHYEACTHLHRSLQAIKALGMEAGVALNPHTPLSSLEEILPYSDFVLVMAVNPGFGGQSFIESTYSKVERLKAMIVKKKYECKIEIDGGITLANAPNLIECGADILVAGNCVFTSGNPEQTIKQLASIGV
jgi:ribulose-phosphate 3-epimerase